MFESLGDRLQKAMDKIKGYGKITEENIKISKDNNYKLAFNHKKNDEEVIKKAIEEGIEVIPIPGACAMVNALICSGLDTKEFTFLGFLPLNNFAILYFNFILIIF